MSDRLTVLHSGLDGITSARITTKDGFLDNNEIPKVWRLLEAFSEAFPRLKNVWGVKGQGSH